MGPLTSTLLHLFPAQTPPAVQPPAGIPPATPSTQPSPYVFHHTGPCVENAALEAAINEARQKVLELYKQRVPQALATCDPKSIQMLDVYIAPAGEAKVCVHYERGGTFGLYGPNHGRDWDRHFPRNRHSFEYPFGHRWGSDWSRVEYHYQQTVAVNWEKAKFRCLAPVTPVPEKTTPKPEERTPPSGSSRMRGDW